MAALSEATGRDIEDLHEETKTDLQGVYESSSMQMETVLHFVHHPMKYVSRKCKECSEYFGSSYHFVAYCSDMCRAKSFERAFGVPWNWRGQHESELWGKSAPPTLILPENWTRLKQIVKILEDYGPIFRAKMKEEDQYEMPQKQEEEVEEISVPEFLPPAPVEEPHHQTPQTAHTSPPELPSFSVPTFQL